MLFRMLFFGPEYKRANISESNPSFILQGNKVCEWGNLIALWHGKYLVLRPQPLWFQRRGKGGMTPPLNAPRNPILPCALSTFLVFFMIGLWKTESLLFTISVLPRSQSHLYIHTQLSLHVSSANILGRQRRERGSSQPGEYLPGGMKTLLLEWSPHTKHTLNKMLGKSQLKSWGL